jgi:hypothetical protein
MKRAVAMGDRPTSTPKTRKARQSVCDAETLSALL